MKTVYFLIRHGRNDIEAISLIEIRIPPGTYHFFKSGQFKTAFLGATLCENILFYHWTMTLTKVYVPRIKQGDLEFITIHNPDK